MQNSNRPKLTLKAAAAQKRKSKQRPAHRTAKSRSYKNTARTDTAQTGTARTGITSQKAAARKKSALLVNATAARHTAFEILNVIITKHQMLDSALTGNREFARLNRRDRAFVRLLVTSCLRRHGQLENIISQLISPDTDMSVRLVLHIGAAQILFLDMPVHAPTSTAVDLVRALGFERQAGLVNAVLRRIIREREKLVTATGIADNLPQWMLTRWRSAWGKTDTDRTAQLAMSPPPLDITAKQDAGAVAAQLEGIQLDGQTVRCCFDGDIKSMPGYNEGLWWVQDAAAAVPARLFGDVRGKSVWDICAAPGGKTAQLAAVGAQVMAVDRDSKRISRLTENLARLNLNAEIRQADILSPEFDLYAKNHRPDCILLDAPCSASGTIRRRPDIFLRPQGDLATFQKTQSDMLAKALEWVADDGMVIYATCSLEPEEGEQIVRAVLETGQAELLGFSAGELGIFAAALAPEGWARILPSTLTATGASTQTQIRAPDEAPDEALNRALQQGSDGFFIARLQKLTA